MSGKKSLPLSATCLSTDVYDISPNYTKSILALFPKAPRKTPISQFLNIKQEHFGDRLEMPALLATSALKSFFQHAEVLKFVLAQEDNN